MCLYASSCDLESFLAKHKGKKTVTAYKIILKLPRQKKLVSLYHHEFSWVPGINRSDNESRRRKIKSGLIGNGIHVYLSRPSRISFSLTRSYHRAVEVTCALKDLLGVDHGEAAFHQVTLSKAEYDKAVRPNRAKKKPAVGA